MLSTCVGIYAYCHQVLALLNFILLTKNFSELYFSFLEKKKIAPWRHGATVIATAFGTKDLGSNSARVYIPMYTYVRFIG
jgi:hypothetical protein